MEVRPAFAENRSTVTVPLYKPTALVKIERACVRSGLEYPSCISLHVGRGQPYATIYLK